MIQRFGFAMLAALCLAYAGCAPKTSPSDPSADLPQPQAAASLPGPAAPDAPVAPAVATIPANLKTDAYDYFGLGYAQPIDMQIAVSGKSGIQTGSVQTALKEIKNGVATFDVTRTGAAAQFGDHDVVSCEPDGVYTLSTSAGSLKAKHLELPAKLPPGKTWTLKTSLRTVNGHDIASTEIYKVVGLSQVATKAGKYQALLIAVSGKAVVDGQKMNTVAKDWFVRGKGAVKMELTTTDAKGKSETMTLQEAAPAASK